MRNWILRSALGGALLLVAGFHQEDAVAAKTSCPAQLSLYDDAYGSWVHPDLQYTYLLNNQLYGVYYFWSMSGSWGPNVYNCSTETWEF